MMKIPTIRSIQEISLQYSTGDAPVMVLCEDAKQYICKFCGASTTIAYKLSCELIGGCFAKVWNIASPAMAFVNIQPAHWSCVNRSHSFNMPAIGFCRLDNVIDITPTTYRCVTPNAHTLYQLLKIALFDCWIANEDRTYNNANLLYDLENNNIISIDYGGILNNVVFDYQLSSLTETDSIVCADVFSHIEGYIDKEQLNNAVENLFLDYKNCICSSKNCISNIIDTVPVEWNIPADKLKNKIEQLFAPDWEKKTWDIFIEYLKNNSKYGN